MDRQRGRRSRLKLQRGSSPPAEGGEKQHESRQGGLLTAATGPGSSTTAADDGSAIAYKAKRTGPAACLSGMHPTRCAPESKDVHPRTNILRPSLGQKLATSGPPGQDTRWATRLPEQWQEELRAPNTAAGPQTYQDGDRRRNQRKAARRPRDTGTLPREAPTRPKAREHCPRRGSPCGGAGDQQSHGMLSPELPRGGSRARPVAASLGDTLSLHKLHLDEAVFWVPWRTPSPPGPSPEATTQRSSRGQAPRPGGLLGKLEPITSPPAQCFQLHLRSATLRPLGRRTPRQSRWLGVTACPPPGLLGAGPCTEQGSRTRDGK